MGKVTLEVPDDLLAKLATGKQDVSQALRLAAAFSLCSRGELTTSQAARLAGLSYVDFLSEAGQAKVDLFQYTLEELDQQLTHALPEPIEHVASEENRARAHAGHR
jgi:predicted HTH domain antitoxin